jgi:hypothetical protein
MHPQIWSWWRETQRLVVRYILVGLAFVPVGLVYATWVVAKGPSPLAFALCLVMGLALADGVWRFSAPRQAVPETLPVISPAMMAALAGPAAEHWSTLGLQSIPATHHQQLFLYLLASHEAGHQLVGISERSHAFSTMKHSREEVPQGVNAAHAAFSGAPS